MTRTVTDTECKDCRDGIYGAMFPRWAALLVIGAFVAISGFLCALSLSARSEASEAKSTAACQARDIEHLTATMARLETNQEKALALLMELRADKK